MNDEDKAEFTMDNKFSILIVVFSFLSSGDHRRKKNPYDFSPVLTFDDVALIKIILIENFDLMNFDKKTLTFFLDRFAMTMAQMKLDFCIFVFSIFDFRIRAKSFSGI